MSSPLLSLAILRVNQEEYGIDYFDSFLPLLARILPHDETSAIDVEQTISNFHESYGLQIPYHAMVNILNRARKKGLLKKQLKDIFPVKEIIEQYDNSRLVESKQQQFNELLEELIRFASNNYKLMISTSVAEQALLNFINEYTLDVLFSSDQASFFHIEPTDRKIKHVVYKFIQTIHSEKPEIFRYILDVVLSHAFASAILYDEPDLFSSKIKGLNIYLDTRFVLQLRGLEGKDCERHADELVALLHTSDVSMFVFNHTYDEISNILNACPDGLRRPDYDPSRASRVLRYMRENSFSPGDAERIAYGLRDFIKSKGIEVIDHPDPDKNKEYQISEERLFEMLDVEYGGNRPNRDQAARKLTIETDVKSISAIYHLRKGHQGRYLKDIKHAFMSTNSVLARVSRDFDVEINDEDFRIPAGVTDFFIGTTVWVHSPIAAERALEHKLLAECFCDVNPDGVLLQKYLEEVEKLKETGRVSTDEYHVLRSHYIAMELLSEKTLNDPDAFNNQTAEDIIEEMRIRLTSDVSKELEKEKEKHKETRNRLEDTEFRTNSFISRVEKLSGLIASIITGLLSLLFVVGVVIQFIPGVFSNMSGLRIFLIALTVILGTVSVLNGFNIKNMRTKLKEWINQKLFNLLGINLGDGKH